MNTDKVSTAVEWKCRGSEIISLTLLAKVPTLSGVLLVEFSRMNCKRQSRETVPVSKRIPLMEGPS